jgi:hypothetical protein
MWFPGGATVLPLGNPEKFAKLNAQIEKRAYF